MIRVTVDLVPYGDEEKSMQIGEMIIANDGTAGPEFCNYVFTMRDDSRGTDFGTLKEFYRPAGIWELIAECISNGSWEKHKLTDLIIDRINFQK